jgi:hypothetical protein
MEGRESSDPTSERELSDSDGTFANNLKLKDSVPKKKNPLASDQKIKKRIFLEEVNKDRIKKHLRRKQFLEMITNWQKELDDEKKKFEVFMK